MTLKLHLNNMNAINHIKNTIVIKELAVVVPANQLYNQINYLDFDSPLNLASMRACKTTWKYYPQVPNLSFLIEYWYNNLWYYGQ